MRDVCVRSLRARAPSRAAARTVPRRIVVVDARSGDVVDMTFQAARGSGVSNGIAAADRATAK
jgi:hypothetical protein